MKQAQSAPSSTYTVLSSFFRQSCHCFFPNTLISIRHLVLLLYVLPPGTCAFPLRSLIHYHSRTDNIINSLIPVRFISFSTFHRQIALSILCVCSGPHVGTTNMHVCTRNYMDILQHMNHTIVCDTPHPVCYVRARIPHSTRLHRSSVNYSNCTQWTHIQNLLCT